MTVAVADVRELCACFECGEPASYVVPQDHDGDPESFWCEKHGVDRIDASPIEAVEA